MPDEIVVGPFCCVWCHDEMPGKFHKGHTHVCGVVMSHAKQMVREIMYALFGEEDAEPERS